MGTKLCKNTVHKIRNTRKLLPASNKKHEECLRLKKMKPKLKKKYKKSAQGGEVKKAQREGLPVDQRFWIYIPVSSILSSLIWLKPTFIIQAKMIVLISHEHFTTYFVITPKKERAVRTTTVLIHYESVDWMIRPVTWSITNISPFGWIHVDSMSLWKPDLYHCGPHAMR